jgi:hypothetical protein
MAGPDAEEARFTRSPPPRDPKNHDQGFAGADIAQKAGEHGAAGIGAGGMLFKDSGATGGAQFAQLRIGALFVGGDARGTDQAASDGALAGFGGVTSFQVPQRPDYTIQQGVYKWPFAKVAGFYPEAGSR